MKSFIPYSLIAAALACGLASAQTPTTAYTVPVGYVSLGDTTAGQPAVKANTDVAVSIPLNQPDEFGGRASACSATTVTVGNTPAWTTNQWAPGAATPYLMSVNSGTQSGFVGLITGNTADTLTVTAVTSGDLSALAVGTSGDQIRIFKAWTLITLFPSGTLPAGTRVLGFTGTSVGANLAPNLVYVWTGTQWTQLTGLPGGAANNTIMYAGESFIIRAFGTQVATLTVTGVVPTANSRTNIDKLSTAAQDNRIAYISPVDEVLGTVGFTPTPGDRILAYNNSTAGINKAAADNIQWNGTYWNGTAGVSGDVTNTYTLKAGRGYTYRRIGTAPVGTVDWKDQQTYIPSLGL